MSLKVPDFHVQVSMFSESKFDAVTIGETHFQIRALMAELPIFFEYLSITLLKTWLKCWRFQS